MENNSYPENSGVIPFKRKRWCFFCYLYSIPFKPGFYVSDSQDRVLALTSNNPNEILTELKRNTPSPTVQAMDTDGLLLDEAIAWHRVTQPDVMSEYETLQLVNCEQIILSQSLRDLIIPSENDSIIGKLTIGPKPGINPNSSFGALILRLGSIMKIFTGYSIPLMIPFIIFQPRWILPILSTFAVNLLIAAFTWPFIHIKSWIKGIFLALFTGGAYSLISYYTIPQFFQPGLSVGVIISALLVGLLLNCSDRPS